MTVDAAAWDALRLSLWVACWATLLAIPLALWVAWLLARREFWGKALLNAAVHLPLVLPPVVTGYLLLMAFGRNAPLGRALDAIGLQLAFHWSGAVLAAIIMGFPLMVRAMRLAIEAVDPKLEDAAATWVPPAPLFSPASPCRLSCPVCWRGPLWALPKPWASLGPRSPLSPISPARPRLCQAPSGPRCKFPVVRVRRWRWCLCHRSSQ